MSKRAERRHQRERMVSRWKKRVKRWFGYREEDNGRPLRWRKGGELIVGRKQEAVEQQAVRRAEHPAHQCEMCRPPKYDRTEEKRADDFMDRVKCPTCGLSLRECDSQDCPPIRKGA